LGLRDGADSAGQHQRGQGQQGRFCRGGVHGEVQSKAAENIGFRENRQWLAITPGWSGVNGWLKKGRWSGDKAPTWGFT
jgi:hypothetical protein